MKSVTKNLSVSLSIKMSPHTKKIISRKYNNYIKFEI
jgi:hypothetical protein